MSGTISWVAYANTGGTYGSGTPYSTTNPGYTWFFDAIGLATSGTVSGAGTISVAQTICLNSTTTASCATDSQGIVTATYGTGAGSTPTFSCMGSALMACSGGNSSLDILNSAQVTHVAFSTTITLNRPGSGVVDLNSFTANIDQFAGVATPEPAAFGLVAAALAAVGIRRRIWRG
jgi:hypothetical protein